MTYTAFTVFSSLKNSLYTDGPMDLMINVLHTAGFYSKKVLIIKNE
jgi:hypothetical protein